MTPSLQRLAAHMLKLAASEFADHSCTDIELPEFVTEEDRAELARLAWESNGRQPDESPSDPVRDDWIVMLALAHALRYEAERP